MIAESDFLVSRHRAPCPIAGKSSSVERMLVILVCKTHAPEPGNRQDDGIEAHPIPSFEYGYPRSP